MWIVIPPGVGGRRWHRSGVVGGDEFGV